MSSFFSRADDGHGTVFSVTPAPFPGSAQASLLFYGGIVCAIVSVPMMAILVGFIMFPLSLLFIYTGSKLRSRFTTENARRVPQKIVVTPSAVAAAGREFAHHDILEFVVTHSAAGPAKVRYERIASGSAAMGATLRENTANAQNYVCFQASVRLRSDSRPIVLVDGLTEQTAEALCRDLAGTLAEARRAA